MRLFRVDDSDNSRDEDENFAARRVMQASFENSNRSDSDSDDASKILIHRIATMMMLVKILIYRIATVMMLVNILIYRIAKVMMLVIYQFRKMLMKDNLRAISGTLFQAEQASLVNKSATLRTEVELQLKTFFQKDQERHHIPKEASNGEVHFVCLLMSPCFVLFRNSR